MVYVIAEMAWSHNGSLQNGIEIVDIAKSSGARAVSLHVTNLETYMAPDYRCLAGTTLSGLNQDNPSVYDYLNEINLSSDEVIELSEYVKYSGLDLILMCNDVESVNLSYAFDVDAYVISAASFLEYELISSCCERAATLYLREGGATIGEITAVLGFIRNKSPNINLILLVGVQSYPTPIEDMNLLSLKQYSEVFKKFDVSVGLADHVDGALPCAEFLPSLALPLGVTVFEKHLTLDRKLEHEDFEAALDRHSFPRFIQNLELSKKFLGGNSLENIESLGSQKKYREVSRKKICLKVKKRSGEVVGSEDLIFLRSDYGAPLNELGRIIGKTLVRDTEMYSGVCVSDVQ